MPIDFPNSPTNGDTYSAGGKNWVYNGSAWTLQGVVPTIPNGSVGASQLATDAVTNAKIASGAVTEAKIADSSITTAKIAAGAVVEADIANNAVTANKIASGIIAPIHLHTDVSLGYRNVAINGSMNVWQRGTTFTASGAYGPDRWIVGRSAGQAGATFTRQQTNDSTNLPNFRFCVRMQRDSGNTGTNQLNIGQVTETHNAIPFAGKIVTLSFYARKSSSSSSSTVYSYIYTGTGIDENGILGAWTGNSNILNSSFTLTNTWQRFSSSATILNTATEFFYQVGWNPIGTAGANDYIEVTGIQLEAGSVATPFEFESFSATMDKCLRYYTKSFSYDTAPVQNSGIGSCAFSPHGGGFGTLIHYRFPQMMRRVPDITGFNPSANNGLARNNSVGGDITNAAVHQVTTTSFNVNFNGTNHDNTSGYQCYWNWTASAEL